MTSTYNIKFYSYEINEDKTMSQSGRYYYLTTNVSLRSAAVNDRCELLYPKIILRL